MMTNDHIDKRVTYYNNFILIILQIYLHGEILLRIFYTFTIFINRNC